MVTTTTLLTALALALMLPLLGSLVVAFDRKLAARMQQRQGPPLTQPWRDLRKLWAATSQTERPAARILAWTLPWIGMAAGFALFLEQPVLAVLLLGSMTAGRIVIGSLTGSPQAREAARRLMLLGFAVELPLLIWVVIVGLAPSGEADDPALWLGAISGAIILLAAWQAARDRGPWDVVEAHQLLIAGETVDLGGRAKANMLGGHWGEIGFFAAWLWIIVQQTMASVLDATWAVALATGAAVLLIWFAGLIVDQAMPRQKLTWLMGWHWALVAVMLGATWAV